MRVDCVVLIPSVVYRNIARFVYVVKDIPEMEELDVTKVSFNRVDQ